MQEPLLRCGPISTAASVALEATGRQKERREIAGAVEEGVQERRQEEEGGKRGGRRV